MHSLYFAFNIGFPGFQTLYIHHVCIRGKMHYKCFISIASLLPFNLNLCGVAQMKFYLSNTNIRKRYFHWNGWRLVWKRNINSFLSCLPVCDYVYVFRSHKRNYTSNSYVNIGSLILNTHYEWINMKRIWVRNN